MDIHVVFHNEQLFPLVFHHVVHQVSEEVSDIRLAPVIEPRRQFNFVLAFIGKEYLESAPMESNQWLKGLEVRLDCT